jgi:hypothetical protein
MNADKNQNCVHLWQTLLILIIRPVQSAAAATGATNRRRLQMAISGEDAVLYGKKFGSIAVDWLQQSGHGLSHC